MRLSARLWAPILALAALLVVPVSASQSTRPTVAVLDFDYGSVQNWWGGQQDIGKGIADLLVDSLLDDGSFRLIERKKLEGILGEQDFNQSDRVDPTAKAAKYGKVLGAKYLIYGSITKFGTEDSNKSVGGGGFGSKFGVGSVGKSSGKANVALTARIIDTSTSEVMLSAKGDGTSKRSGLMLSGAGGGSKVGAGGLNFGSSDFKDTIIGEATEQAVKALSAALVAKKDRLNGGGK
jgi:curli biogenesis system outer membrane secretion channel CsgG